MNCRTSAHRALSVALACALTASLGMPALAWATDEGSLAEAAELRGVQGGAAPAAVDAMGPLRVFYSIDGGVEQEMGRRQNGDEQYVLVAPMLDPAQFKTLRLRLAASDGYSFEAGSAAQIVDAGVQWQTKTSDGMTLACGIDLRAEGSSLMCDIPALLLQGVMNDEYDHFTVTWGLDEASGEVHGANKGTYHGFDLFAAGDPVAFDDASLMGTYRSESGTVITLAATADGTRTKAIGDEVDPSGNPAVERFTSLDVEYDSRGSVRGMEIVVGSSTSARLATGVDADGSRTLVSKDSYTYRTAGGAGTGRISAGEVFAREEVASVEGVKYSSVQEAVDAASAGATVKLLKDADVSHPVVVRAGADIVLDLNGKALTGRIAASSKIDEISGTVEAAGSLRIVGGGELSNKTDARNVAAVLIRPSGTVRLDDVAVKSSGTVGSSGSAVYAYGGLTVEGARIESDDVGIACNGASNVVIEEGTVIVVKGNCISTKASNPYESNVVVNGGTFTTAIEGVTGGDYWQYGTVYWADYGTLTINGGMFATTLPKAPAVYQKNGTVVISGGTFSACDAVKGDAGSGDTASITTRISGGSFEGTRSALYLKGTNGDAFSVSISGGTFVGGSESALYEKGSNATVTVTGGAFSTEVPTAYRPTGYESTLREDGMHVVGAVAYAISYDLAGGTFPSSASAPATYTAAAAIALPKPERAGYEFAGWTGTGLSSPTPNAVIVQGSTGNRSYTATWKAKEARVSFDSHGGSAVSDLVGTTDDPLSGTLPVPTRAGYTFAGWYADAELTRPVSALPTTFPAGVTIYHAKWIVPMPPDTSIDVDVEVPRPVEGEPSVTVPDETVKAASEQAQNVLGIIASGGVPAGMSAEDAQTVARIIDSAQEGERVSVTVAIKADMKSEAPDAEKAAIANAAASSEDAVLYFDLSVAMTVRVVASDGTVKDQSQVALREVDEPLLVELAVDPDAIRGKSVRVAHVHEGQTEVIDPVSIDRERGIVRFRADRFSTFALLTSSIVTVEFRTNGGTPVEAQEVLFGKTVAKPADPVLAGYAFAGWHVDEALQIAYDFNVPVERPLVLYAKWVPESAERPELPAAGEQDPPKSGSDQAAPLPKAGKLAATSDGLGSLVIGFGALALVAGALGHAAVRRRC